MATTKVGGGLVDLNSDNTAFKMPVGSSYFTGTPVAGMIRNNSSISNGTAQTTFEYYNGTSWVGMSAPPIPIIVSFLVIAGGGSGGSPGTVNDTEGAGGGAGGYRNSYSTELSGASSPTETPLSFTSGTTYTITVGGGGAAVNTRGAVGNNGSNSSIVGADITSIISIGGGMGATAGVGANNPQNGQNGGSGGGGTDYFGNASSSGSGTAGQGTNGGQRCYSDGAKNGGGASSSLPNGLYSSITGSSVGRGGGGQGAENFLGCRSSACSNHAGLPFGGARAWANSTISGCSQTATAGTPNTGGGGGGGLEDSSILNYGTNGGSGVVILRMLTSIYSGTQSGASVTTDGSDTILTYTGSGTYTA